LQIFSACASESEPPNTVQLHERPGVEQRVESFPGGQLALLVLRRDPVGAAAQGGLGALLLQQVELFSHAHEQGI